MQAQYRTRRTHSQGLAGPSCVGANRRLLAPNLTLAQSARQRENTLRFARALGAEIGPGDRSARSFHIACRRTIEDHLRGMNLWTSRTIQVCDYTGVDIVALADAVGGSSFAQAVEQLENEAQGD